jgi:hypothetical protein
MKFSLCGLIDFEIDWKVAICIGAAQVLVALVGKM